MGFSWNTQQIFISGTLSFILPVFHVYVSDRDTEILLEMFTAVFITVYFFCYPQIYRYLPQHNKVFKIWKLNTWNKASLQFSWAIALKYSWYYFYF